MDKKLNILWLPAWFPSRVNFLGGDFTERYADAISAYSNITILYVVKDVSLSKRSQVEIERKGSMVIYRSYYSGKDKQGVAGRIISLARYHYLLFSLYNKATKERGNFSFVHIHVPLRQSLLAVWLKIKNNLNYVITEQHSWYMPNREGFFTSSRPVQAMIKYVFKNASKVHTVSHSLGKELIFANLVNSYTVIPNVVNTTIFNRSDFKTENDSGHTDFIAITGDVFHKNTDGIIRAFTKFVHLGHRASLHIVGPNINFLEQLSKDLGIYNNIIFYGAVSNEKVASAMQKCDAMIFFTRFETFGCVMAEALCCGIPIIASKLPVLEENLIESENGIFVIPENEDDLTSKLVYFTKNFSIFNKGVIAEVAKEKYNYSKVAKQMIAFYTSIESEL